MSPSPHVTVRIDLSRVRANAEAVRHAAGVPVIAVVKADAYGLGAERLLSVIDDLVEGYCVFSIREAAEADVYHRTGKTSIVLSPPQTQTMEPDDWREAGARPCVSTADQALQLADADPVLVVDTGMQRFACPREDVDEVLAVGACREAMTHATSPEQVKLLLDAAGGRGLRLHAAGSSLLHDPAARLDAVRPGLALYRGAVCAAARLVEVRRTAGPAGYSHFESTTGHHGVILAGYANGLGPGPCLVNGRPARVREVGMQSAFVETAPGDRVGDEVVLFGDALSVEEDARAWQMGPHELLVRMCGIGLREYTGA